MSNSLINAKQAAEYLHVTPQTITAMLRKRALKGIKIGARWYTTIAWCNALVHANL